MKKFLAITVTTIILLLGIFIWWHYYKVFGEGVKSGELNFFVKKGYLFKTYEGKLILAGFKSGPIGGMQSNEFEFSVERELVAQQLMANGGKTFQLHYKEYSGRIPWRGNTVFIVDSIWSMK
jgi:hypothetical protein